MNIKHRLRIRQIGKINSKPAEKGYNPLHDGVTSSLPCIYSILGSEIWDSTGHRNSSASENKNARARLNQPNLEEKKLKNPYLPATNLPIVFFFNSRLTTSSNVFTESSLRRFSGSDSRLKRTWKCWCLQKILDFSNLPQCDPVDIRWNKTALWQNRLQQSSGILTSAHGSRNCVQV